MLREFPIWLAAAQRVFARRASVRRPFAAPSIPVFTLRISKHGPAAPQRRADSPNASCHCLRSGAMSAKAIDGFPDANPLITAVN
jgi:hypothetical protein